MHACVRAHAQIGFTIGGSRLRVNMCDRQHAALIRMHTHTSTHDVVALCVCACAHVDHVQPCQVLHVSGQGLAVTVTLASIIARSFPKVGPCRNPGQGRFIKTLWLHMVLAACRGASEGAAPVDGTTRT